MKALTFATFLVLLLAGCAAQSPQHNASDVLLADEFRVHVLRPCIKSMYGGSKFDTRMRDVMRDVEEQAMNLPEVIGWFNGAKSVVRSLDYVGRQSAYKIVVRDCEARIKALGFQLK